MTSMAGRTPIPCSATPDRTAAQRYVLERLASNAPKPPGEVVPLPSPDSGEVIQLPPVVTAQGKAALAALGPGQQIVTVWSRQTAIKVTIIR